MTGSVQRSTSQQHIRCDEITPARMGAVHPRHKVDALAQSIRRHGILRPVLVRRAANGYLIVHGERRWRAARMIGLEEIPARRLPTCRPNPWRSRTRELN